MMGRRQCTLLPTIIQNSLPESVQAENDDAQVKDQAEMKKYHDRKAVTTKKPFSVGDHVMFKQPDGTRTHGTIADINGDEHCG